MRRELCKWCKQNEPEHERVLCTSCLDRRAEARGRNPQRRAMFAAMFAATGSLYSREVRRQKGDDE